jgi:hypothetical protein
VSRLNVDLPPASVATGLDVPTPAEREERRAQLLAMGLSEEDAWRGERLAYNAVMCPDQAMGLLMWARAEAFLDARLAAVQAARESLS